MGREFILFVSVCITTFWDPGKAYTSYVYTVNKHRSSRPNELSASHPESAEGNSQSSMPFLSALLAVEKDLQHKFFFPGHCGGKFSPSDTLGLKPSMKYDLPELDGLDNIHNPDGPLLRSLQLAAELFGSLKTWFLVNGSTSGILVAILSCVRIYEARRQPEGSEGPYLIVARNAHKAVFDALNLCRCNAILLPVVYDKAFNVPIDVEYEKIEEALKKYKGEICGLLLTRPSYNGVLSSTTQLKRIVSLARSHGVPVIVDEAHGSHLRFTNRSDLLGSLSP